MEQRKAWRPSRVLCVCAAVLSFLLASVLSVLLLAGVVVHGIEDSERSPRGEATMSNDVDSPLAVYVLVVVLSLIAAVVAMVGSRAAGFVLAVAAAT